ncbi:hypothetical protein SPBR_01954 [Sporothrix brasiliensis 5110]|uniref:Aminoglycoside phosphotransferase domain-containing protein n=1 Tax=Sporothrix brasiliensis 5110 TaxID=1398154 RepID=A0A0C2EX45_9PEZI|nr:uncharacterized protein SPBR_01954 [Sporothrix brasiliensis 5110]KIH91134.1 hypothetical protein SPBR_01954 [Sporothrix brasiliensis 5110]
MANAADKPSATVDSFKARLRKKKIERGLPVSPTPSELARDNVLEDDGTVLYNLLGRMISLHPGNIVKKAGRAVRLGEADALKVAAAGGVPVPDVFGTEVTPEGRFRISMSYIEGQTLEAAWPSLSEDDKTCYCRQVGAILTAMRAIPPPDPSFIGACDGKEIRDGRLYSTYMSPVCADEDAFNAYLVSSIAPATPDAVREAFVRRLQSQPRHRIVLTHGDLAPRNIMVRDGRVVALIDWEEAGWYPEYWEYVKFFQRSTAMEKDWRAHSKDIFDEAYPDELVDYIAVSKFQYP